MWWQSLMHFLGISSTSGYSYNFWSGFGSDIGEIAIIGGAYQVIRHTNCHVVGCWRVGKHEVAGTPYKVCRVHHPGIDKKPTVQDIVDAHKAANEVKVTVPADGGEKLLDEVRKVRARGGGSGRGA